MASGRDDDIDENAVWRALGYSSVISFALGVLATRNVGERATRRAFVSATDE